MPEQHKRGILADRWKTIHKQQSTTRPCFLWVSKNSVDPHCPQELEDKGWHSADCHRTFGSCWELPIPTATALHLALPQPASPAPYTVYTHLVVFGLLIALLSTQRLFAPMIYFLFTIAHTSHMEQDKTMMNFLWDASMLHCLLPGRSSTLVLIWTLHSPVIGNWQAFSPPQPQFL